MTDDHPTSESGTVSKETRLLLGGVERADLTAEFLTNVHEVADEEGLSVERISVEGT